MAKERINVYSYILAYIVLSHFDSNESCLAMFFNHKTYQAKDHASASIKKGTMFVPGRLNSYLQLAPHFLGNVDTHVAP